MAEVDRVTARAPVEAGYMPLRIYLERFGSRHDPEHVDSPSTAPDPCEAHDAREASQPVLQAYVFTILEQR
jgi:hypothetical protein